MKESLHNVRFVASERWGNLVLWILGTITEPSEKCFSGCMNCSIVLLKLLHSERESNFHAFLKFKLYVFV
jgi:hypothetical protein